MSTEADPRKNFRFYGRRQGHALKPARQRLLETLLPRVQLNLPSEGEQVALAKLFPDAKRAYWMEIGFGGGEHLAALAARYPEVGFVGCEPFINGVASLLSHIDRQALSNIRIYNDDARHLLPLLPDASFGRLYLPYADPWPKTRHHRRRLVQSDTVDTFARLLEDNGEFRFASDFMNYVRWTLDHVAGHPDFQWMAEGPDDWRTRPDDSVETRYEAKARKAGSQCVYLTFRRRPRA